jgi:hypothetical protein
VDVKPILGFQEVVQRAARLMSGPGNMEEGLSARREILLDEIDLAGGNHISIAFDQVLRRLFRVRHRVPPFGLTIPFY